MSGRYFALYCALMMLTDLASADTPSPYAGQASREIKALSAQQIADYRAGNGMGLARAAELNGYPGPAHVLELASALDLSANQRARTEALFAQMQARAITIGKALVDEERALDRHFAARTIDPELLTQAMARIGTLLGELRQVHLHAHLEQAQVLSAPQIARYVELRGYAAGNGQDAPAGHAHGHR